MPDKICLADCLYQDELGRIALRTDNDTITCVDDGTGNSQLVATGGLKDCAPWPFACDASLNGQPVYCDAQGRLYAGLKPYYKTSPEIGSYSPINNLPQLLQINNQVLRQLTTTYTNDDGCGRTVELEMDFYFNGFALRVQPSTGLYLLPEYTENGSVWVPIQGLSYYNFDSAPIIASESAVSWKRRIKVNAGQTVTIGMRWKTGLASQGHTPGQNFAATSQSLYGINMYWSARNI